jgi:hypothetical protein
MVTSVELMRSSSKSAGEGKSAARSAEYIIIRGTKNAVFRENFTRLSYLENPLIS